MLERSIFTPTRPGPWLPAALAAAALTMGGSAQAAELVGRSTNVFGNFLVGTGPLFDDGSFSELLGTLALSYGQEASDAGAVNGEFRGAPVQGSASFASGAGYVFAPEQVVGQGHAETTGETPFATVSLGANAISQVRLEFTVPQITPFTLSGSVLAQLGPDMGTRTSQALASVQFSGCIGCLWSADTQPGGFNASGTLQPGITYTITGRASSRLNGSGQYAFNLALAPVPEPGSALLLALGVPVLLWARRRRTSAPPPG